MLPQTSVISEQFPLALKVLVLLMLGGLQHRVLISAAYSSSASLVLLPAHAADDHGADDDSGHYCDDDEGYRSIIRNRSLFPLSAAGDFLRLRGGCGLDSRRDSASSSWRGIWFPPLPR